MNAKTSTTYSQELSTRSRPLFPGEGTANKIAKWHREVAAHEEQGLNLLFEHYRASISMLDSPLGQMRDLALALARDHVSYFSSKQPKSSSWNIHEHAKFLFDVQQELKKHKDLRAAVRNAGGRLPRHLHIESERSLKRRYYFAQEKLAGLVTVDLDGAIKPQGETQGRLFNSLLRDDYYDLTGVRFEPCPDDPDAEIVSGLSTEE
jgi:hypothetical protein